MSTIITDTAAVIIASLTGPIIGRWLRALLVEMVSLIAITTGQTLVRDYIEDHFHKRPHHRTDTGAPTEPEH